MTHSIRFLTKGFAPDELLFESMTHSAGLSELGETELALLSSKSDIAPEDLLGHPVSVRLRLADESERHFNGYVTRIGLGVHRGRFYGYQATVRPWLWFLTRRTDCRIFQNKTVPDIVKEVFEAHKIADFKFQLFREYRERVYCVQYRESDFNFAMRLLEHEGIYWYFAHTEDRHTLVMVDSVSAHDAEPNCESLPYYDAEASIAPDLDHIKRWTFQRHVKSGKVVLKDYDFERPSVLPAADAAHERQYEMADYEWFDYQPGTFVKAADGEQYARDRMDEFQSGFEVHRGSSNSRSIEAGRLLKLTRHPRDEQNAEYLLTRVNITASVDGYEATSRAEDVFDCAFSAIPSAQQFRPRRQTPKPIVQGPQTALVVGTGDIHTDKYGRIKVQFYWDRYGKRDDKSSCWIRVSQNWGGKGWGGMFIPHVGQEVIVEFLEGDPDQPLVTGRVYNAENMPPVALPAGKTKSIIRDHGGNQIRMEGAAGSEQLHLFSPFANSKLSLGAPNGNPGVFISTEAEMKILVTELVDQQFKANYKREVHGTESKKNKGNVDWTWSADFSWTTLGNKNEVTGGFKNSLILGMSTSLIGGIKLEKVSGAEFKANLGAKAEYVWGATMKIHKGRRYETQPDAVELSANKIMAKAAKAQFAALEEEQKIGRQKEIIDAVDQNFKTLDQKISKVTQQITELWMKVGKYKVEADEIALTSSNAMKILTDVAKFSGSVDMDGALDVRGKSFKFGSTLSAKG